MVHGVVYAVIQNGFFIEDATGQLFVYTTAVTYEVGAEVELIGEVGSYGGEYQLINLVTNPSALSFFNQINMSPELYKHTTTILEAGQLYTVIGKVAIEGPYSNVYIYLNETEKFEIYYKSPQSSIDALKAYAGELVAVDIIYNNSGTRFVYVGETEGVRLCTEVTDLSDLLFMDDGSWVLVKGIVTFNSFDGLFIQDSLGLGLFMYKPEETNISIGDEVIYLGELSTYSGARQLAYGAKLAEVLTIGNSLIVTPITADGIDAFSITDVGRLYSFDGFTYEGLDPNDNRHMILGYTLYDGVTTGTVSVRYYENYPDMILVADNYTVGDTLPLVEFLLYNFRDGLTQINVASVDFTDTDKLLLDANALPESLILTSDYVIPTPEHGSTYTVIDISSELVDLIEEVTIPGTLLVIRPLDGEPDAVGTITIRVNNGAITPIEVVIQVTIPAEPPVTVGPEVVTASYLGATSTNMVDGNNAELV
ncbi:MAG: hypothetical protein RBR50_09775 [Candidatus Izemoplasmatales bacterium]|nr:hypothetical protein [Candidatus Izemoplasmatales bacterium]